MERFAFYIILILASGIITAIGFYFFRAFMLRHFVIVVFGSIILPALLFSLCLLVLGYPIK